MNPRVPSRDAKSTQVVCVWKVLSSSTTSAVVLPTAALPAGRVSLWQMPFTSSNENHLIRIYLAMVHCITVGIKKISEAPNTGTIRNVGSYLKKIND